MSMVNRGENANKTQKPFDVFVSHSSKDSEKARAVVEALETGGVRCWIAPRNIMPGSDYGEAIVEGIEGSQLMVLVFSNYANESPQITREIERAVHHGMRIIPFRIENVAPSRSLEYFLSSPHWLDAYAGVFSDHLEYLNASVRHLLGYTASIALPAPVRAPRYQSIYAQFTTVVADIGAGIARLFVDTLRIVSGLLSVASGIEGVFVAVLKQWKWIAGVCAAAALGFVTYSWITYLPFDRAFIGKWQMSIPGVAVAGVPEIKQDGSYTLLLAFQETGTVEIRNGWLYLLPRNGRERRVVWEPIDANTVASSLIPEEFLTLSARLAPERHLEFSNFQEGSPVWTIEPEEKRPETLRWQVASSDNGPVWNFIFETGPGAAYRFRATQNDRGTIHSEGTVLTLNSEQSGTIQLEYKIASENTLSLTTPLGNSTWKRAAAETTTTP